MLSANSYDTEVATRGHLGEKMKIKFCKFFHSHQHISLNLHFNVFVMIFNTNLEMFKILSILLRTGCLHLLFNPHFKILTLSHVGMKALGAFQLTTSICC